MKYQTKDLYKCLNSLTECFYLLFCGLYLAFCVSQVTTLYFPYPIVTEKALFYGVASAAALRVIIHWKERLMWFSLIPGAVYWIAWRVEGYPFLQFLAVMTIGCVGIHYRRLLRTWLVSVGSVMIITILCSLGGAITNLVYMKDGWMRSSWGFCYPTNFASIILFFMMILWVAWEKLSDYAALAFGACSLWISFYVARSYTSTICSVLFMAVILYRALEKQFIEKRGKLLVLKRMIDMVIRMAFPVLMFITLFLIWAYQKGYHFAVVLNRIMTNRVQLAADAYIAHGLHPFGARFDLIGAGSSTYDAVGYNFIDSSYSLILIRYGFILLLLFCLIWVWMSSRVIREGNRRMALIMIVIVVHSFSEHHFPDIYYNIFLVMPFAVLGGGRTVCQNRTSKGVAHIITVVCSGIICLILLPKGLSWFRTLVTRFGLTGGGKNAVIVFAVVAAALFLLVILIGCLSGIVGALVSHQPVSKTLGAIMVCCLVIIGGVVWKCNRILIGDLSVYAQMMDADADAMEAIIREKTGKVYVTKLPDLYNRRFGQISNSIFDGEDLARFSPVTVVMDAETDSPSFIESGFLYAQISDTHCVYTNDEPVILALEEKGDHLTGFYSFKEQMDLKEEARMNGLSMTEEGGILLEGTDRSLIYGPYKDLYQGKYTLTYQMRIKNEPSKEDYEVCRLKVQAYWGEKVLKEISIYHSQFDKSGELTLEVPITISDYMAMEFLVYMGDGQQMELRSITWQKTPDYDIHGIYGADRRKIRDEYYNLQGDPLTVPDGYHSVAYTYDRAGNVNTIRYYGEDEQPVMIKAGYTEIRKLFNARRQVIREEYYDIDGQLAILESGYAAWEKEYDHQGNVIVQRYYDAEGSLCMITNGYAMTEMIYDEDGHAIIQRYYDKTGNQIRNSAGYAEIHRSYDEKGQVILEQYYDEKGVILTLETGNAGVGRVFDDDGNTIVYIYLDEQNRPIMSTNGYAEIHQEFNDVRQVIRKEFYNEKGEPIALPGGQSAEEYRYDAAGNIISYRYFDEKNNPIITSNGYAEIHQEFNDARQLVRKEFYNEKGEPIALSGGQSAEEYRYDAAGNIIYCRYFDEKNNPVMTTLGYAEIHKEYDENRRVIRESYYDTDGEPVLRKEGYQAVERKYDDDGNVIEQSYYGLRGELIQDE